MGTATDINWQVVYFVDNKGNNPVSKFLDTLSGRQQSKVLRILHNIEEYGLSSVIPHVRKLSGTPLWEIRILGQDNIRVIYVVPSKLKVIVLHGFIKKKQKTPFKEIDIALSRFKLWQISG